MSDDARKDLPAPSAPNFGLRVREEVMRYLGRTGNKLDRGVTVRDLVAAGMVTLRAAFDGGSSSGPPGIFEPGPAIPGAYEPDLTPPPTPTGLAVAAGINFLLIECDAQVYPQGHGHDKTLLYGATGMPSQAVALTIASPCVATLARPPVSGQKVLLATTGALPTGLAPATTYYTVNVSGLTCNLSLTEGGAAIDTSGTQSGDHTAEYSPTFGDAVLLGEFNGTVYAHATNPATQWHIWIKWRSVDGVVSVDPAGGANGVTATTAQDVRTLLDALTQAANNPSAQYSNFAVRAGLFYVASDTGTTFAPVFSVVTTPITINGVEVPVGVYFADGFIQNGTIVTAKIGDLQVTDAKMVSLSVAKLIAGSIAVGEYIQSTGYVAGSTGWKISGNGDIEGNNGVFRGAIFASSGTIGGLTIGSNYIRSTGYSLGVTGYNFNSDGTGQIGGIHFLGTAIQSDNYVAGVSGFKIGQDGSIEAGNVTLFGGLIRNAANTAALDLNASGNTQSLLRAGSLASRECVTPSGSWGTESAYDVDIRPGGWAYFQRGSLSGAKLLAGSSSYAIPDKDRPAILFAAAPPPPPA